MIRSIRMTALAGMTSAAVLLAGPSAAVEIE